MEPTKTPGSVVKMLRKSDYTEIMDVADDVKHWAKATAWNSHDPCDQCDKMLAAVWEFVETAWGNPDVDAIQLVSHPYTNSAAIRVCTWTKSHVISVV
ncbi:MAG: hypothetical protein WC732_08815 [Candidatus Omnitrophota bacterium]